ncbi:guanylate kinase [soil metagenome]
MTLSRATFPVILAAPSGAGKTTIARALLERRPDVRFSVSATTRAPRASERDGRDYWFVGEAEFDRMVAADELLEWANVHGRRYGTPRRNLEQAQASGEHLLLDIDVQGAEQIRARVAGVVSIFVLPPSGEVLVDRLLRRASDDPASLRRRLRKAAEEVRASREFEYLVVNDDLDLAVEAVLGILTGEEERSARCPDLDIELEELAREIEAARPEAATG